MRISKFGHACLLVEEGAARVLIDPGAFSKGFEGLTGLQAIFITHQHQDHLVPENIQALLATNPEAKVYADAGSAQVLQEAGVSAQAVHAGEEFEVAGVKVVVMGTDHAVIHPTMPGIPNVGYLIAGRLFVPGDNFTVPRQPIEVLALPLGAPWSKVSEVVDYMMAVRPKVTFPVHDAVLAMPQMHINIAQSFAEPAGIELRVIPNGQSMEV